MSNNNSRNLNPNSMYTSPAYTNFNNQYNPMGNFKPLNEFSNKNNKQFGNYDAAFAAILRLKRNQW